MCLTKNTDYPRALCLSATAYPLASHIRCLVSQRFCWTDTYLIRDSEHENSEISHSDLTKKSHNMHFFFVERQTSSI